MVCPFFASFVSCLLTFNTNLWRGNHPFVCIWHVHITTTSFSVYCLPLVSKWSKLPSRTHTSKTIISTFECGRRVATSYPPFPSGSTVNFYSQEKNSCCWKRKHQSEFHWRMCCFVLPQTLAPCGLPCTAPALPVWLLFLLTWAARLGFGHLLRVGCC